jgi:phosphohistidine phosphatase
LRRLLVMRHAKAERESSSGADFDRALAERGWRDAERVGRAMQGRRLMPDLVLASPARRTRESVAALERVLGPLPAKHDERLYGATVAQLVEVVREIDDAAQTLLLVGHNPGVHELVLGLSGGNEAGTVNGFPTAALAVIDLDATSWRDVATQAGRLADLIEPKKLG